MNWFTEALIIFTCGAIVGWILTHMGPLAVTVVHP